VIPAHDEGRVIGSVVRALRGRYASPVVVVNDASGDDTRAEAERAGALVIDLPLQLGSWGATQAGIRFALSRSATLVVTLDADGQHPPGAVEALLAPVLAGRADVVIGQCVARASSARRLAWRLFRAITQLSVNDLTSGFRAYNRRALSKLATPEATLLDFQDIGVLSLLREVGCRILEVEVPMRQRTDGKSRVFYSWLAVAYYLAYTGLLGFSKIELRPRAPK
jgi:glycosyltransferase involved in cell wall biosynthesis